MVRYDLRRRHGGFLAGRCSVEILSEGDTIAYAEGYHFPRNGDLVVRPSPVDSTERFRLAAETSDSWVHAYDLVDATDGKLGTFEQADRKAGSNADWTFSDAEGREVCVLAQRSRLAYTLGQVLHAAHFVAHKMDLVDGNGTTLARVRKRFGHRYNAHIDVIGGNLDERVVLGATCLGAIHNYRVS